MTVRITEYVSFDAVGLAELVAKGEVTPAEREAAAREGRLSASLDNSSTQARGRAEPPRCGQGATRATEECSWRAGSPGPRAMH
ncbi:hypothetical protein FF041_29380 [Streptomyces jumonjinensis]|uniref:Uncharacterized protein n=1 Tax=Streptomyces jumonjinensis TaxID=1945 RepID=A0A646KQG6_STRJU|nr:hypothetical protein [Streptomyces jumonjinensis]